jgi:hypothetical protein
MRDFWTIGLSGAALFLRTTGFSWQESDRLLQLKLRYERGDFREKTDEQKRLEFAKWLVQHGRYTDQLEDPSWYSGRRRPAA